MATNSAEKEVPEWVLSMACGILSGMLDRRHGEYLGGHRDGLDMRVVTCFSPGLVDVEVTYPHPTGSKRYHIQFVVQAAPPPEGTDMLGALFAKDS